MDTLGHRDEIEGSDITQFRTIAKPVWLAEACLILIDYMIISLFDLYVRSLDVRLKLVGSHFVK